MKFNFHTVLAAIFFLISSVCNAQNISTIAGNGTGSFSGDGGAANLATINSPYGIALDAAGNIYIADCDNQRIRMISTSGIITTVAGNGIAGYAGDGGAATSARLNYPNGIAVDGSGNIYICDAGNQRIRKVTASTGVITTIAGNGIMGYEGDGGLATAASLNFPRGIAIDATGNIYIADQVNNRIRKINTHNIISTIAGSGTPGYSGDGGTATSAELSSPSGVAIDNSGNVYIADEANHAIRKINSAGIISTIAGDGTSGFSGDGGPGASAELNYPKAVTVDATGNVYIADEENQRVRMLNTWGIINTIAGDGTAGFNGDGNATTSELNEPWWVTADAMGNVYVADNYNNRVRKISAYNYPPHFTGGHNQTITICENAAVSTDSLLSVIDSNAGQTETWSLVTPPTNGAAIATYTMTSTNAIITPTGLSYTPTSGFIGTDSFKVQISDGIATDITTIYVVVAPLPNAGTITTPGNLCVGSAATLTSSVAGGTWSATNASVTLSAASATAAAPGTDTIIYTVTNSCGTANVSNTITIAPVVTAAITVSTSSSNICSGTMSSFTTTIANGGVRPSYQWLKNGIATGTDTSVYTTNTLDNGDVISCVLTTSALCATAPTTTSEGLKITVNANVTPAITITTSVDTLCASAPVTISSSSVNGGTTPAYQWYVSGVATATGSTFSYTPANGDEVTCVMTSNAACASTASATSNNIPFTVYSNATSALAINSPVDSITNFGETTTFSSTITNPLLSPTYQWYINNVAVTGATASNFTTQVYHNDTVYCIVTMQTPCENTITDTSNNFVVYADYLATPNITSNISGLSLFPNPNAGSFVINGTVTNPNHEKVTVTVYNMLGSVVYSNDAAMNNEQIHEQINLDNISNGNYVVRVSSGTESHAINFTVNR